jgi:polar amino acid transport system permease protein
LFWYFAFTALVKNLGNAINVEGLAHFSPDPIAMAILGLTICYGAYMSEIYRAGIQSISKGQMEAARSLGMSSFQAMRYVILPQAIRVVLPPMGNEFISLLKDSSLVSVVAVADLTRRGREFMAQTGASFETWAIVAMIYLVMTIFSARVVNIIEKRTRTTER